MLGTEPSRPLPGQGAVAKPFAARRGERALLAAVLLVLGGCAGSTASTSATRDEVRQLQAEVNRLQRAVQRLQAPPPSPPPPAVRPRDLEPQVTALARDVQALAASTAGLSTRIDELTSRLESQARSSRATPTVPRALAPPSAAPALTPPPPAAPVPAPPSDPAPAPRAALPPDSRPSTGAPSAQDMYQTAYIDFSKGSYPLSITGFREFLRRYPDDPMAGSAQYWIGEAQLGVARSQSNAGQMDRATVVLEQAVQEFRKVVANYPRSGKAPAALYKEALTLIELKQPGVAQARLQYLVDNFPQAAEVSLAREQLADLKKP